MKKLLILLALLVPLLQGCSHQPRKTSWAVTLNHEGKNPYDTWLAWESLPHYFPQANRELISRSFRYMSIDASMMQHSEDSAALLVMAGLDYYISEEEWDKIKQFARLGNEVLIISSNLDNKIETALKCSKSGNSEERPLNRFYDGTVNQHILALANDSTRHYGYTGRTLESYFDLPSASPEDSSKPSPQDSTAQLSDYNSSEPSTATTIEEGEQTVIGAPEVLGYAGGHPDMLRYAVGNGHITLHAAPLAFSNYFLLQEGNRAYLDGIWHSFPDNISNIYWNEYYKRSTEGSSMNVLWRYPATRWALILAISTLVIYVLLGLKRRQRIVPIMKPLENASVSFVETVGRLYFNKGNHANLAEKMIQHFLEWVRTYYFIDTSKLNEAFVQQLASKSGKSEEAVQQLVAQIHEVRLGSVIVTQEYLFALHQTLQSFYNNQSI